jgi:hypothetical protein
LLRASSSSAGTHRRTGSFSLRIWSRDEVRPARSVARKRVLRLGQGRRWIGGAQSFEMFLGLLAELFERWTFRQTPAGGNGHDDLLSNIARVRTTG